jgi:hypothetical protein
VLLNEGVNRCVSIVGIGAVREPLLQAFIPRISNAELQLIRFTYSRGNCKSEPDFSRSLAG